MPQLPIPPAALALFGVSLEIYVNADAFLAHVKNMRATGISQEAPQIRKPVKMVVFGFPNAEMKEILARRDPVYETYIDGFMR